MFTSFCLNRAHIRMTAKKVKGGRHPSIPMFFPTSALQVSTCALYFDTHVSSAYQHPSLASMNQVQEYNSIDDGFRDCHLSRNQFEHFNYHWAHDPCSGEPNVPVNSNILKSSSNLDFDFNKCHTISPLHQPTIFPQEFHYDTLISTDRTSSTRCSESKSKCMMNSITDGISSNSKIYISNSSRCHQSSTSSSFTQAQRPQLVNVEPSINYDNHTDYAARKMYHAGTPLSNSCQENGSPSPSTGCFDVQNSTSDLGTSEHHTPYFSPELHKIRPINSFTRHNSCQSNVVNAYPGSSLQLFQNAKNLTHPTISSSMSSTSSVSIPTLSKPAHTIPFLKDLRNPHESAPIPLLTANTMAYHTLYSESFQEQTPSLISNQRNQDYLLTYPDIHYQLTQHENDCIDSNETMSSSKENIHKQIDSLCLLSTTPSPDLHQMQEHETNDISFEKLIAQSISDEHEWDITKNSTHEDINFIMNSTSEYHHLMEKQEPIYELIPHTTLGNCEDAQSVDQQNLFRVTSDNQTNNIFKVNLVGLQQNSDSTTMNKSCSAFRPIVQNKGNSILCNDHSKNISENNVNELHHPTNYLQQNQHLLGLEICNSTNISSHFCSHTSIMENTHTENSSTLSLDLSSSDEFLLGNTVTESSPIAHNAFFKCNQEGASVNFI